MDVGRKVAIEVCYRGRSIGVFYPDLIVNQTILVEVKATASIENFAIAQTLNYLKVAGGGVGLLLNFGHKAESQRLVMGDRTTAFPLCDSPLSSLLKAITRITIAACLTPRDSRPRTTRGSLGHGQHGSHWFALPWLFSHGEHGFHWIAVLRMSQRFNTVLSVSSVAEYVRVFRGRSNRVFRGLGPAQPVGNELPQRLAMIKFAWLASSVTISAGELPRDRFRKTRLLVEKSNDPSARATGVAMRTIPPENDVVPLLSRTTF